jgi:DNA-binding NarL/FixJ family response regulator
VKPILVRLPQHIHEQLSQHGRPAVVARLTLARAAILGRLVSEEEVNDLAKRNAAIRAAHDDGNTVRSIADDYGLSTRTVRRVINQDQGRQS